ncbi:hypothetical protein [Polynucleobacter sp.]|jgi:type IV secretory pathway TrbL component|uniref:hypothetical protein n=1 Tax=Polynucleobacter sp. TaxID=2029855 RepID=UPI003016BE2A
MLSVKRNKPLTQAKLLTWVGLFLVFNLICLQGCVAPLAALGASGTAAASTAGTTVATAAVANPVTATSLASSATTGKSPLEHATSAATKKDCSFINALSAKPICVDIPVPTITDNSSPLLGPADFVIQPVTQ